MKVPILENTQSVTSHIESNIQPIQTDETFVAYKSPNKVTSKKNFEDTKKLLTSFKTNLTKAQHYFSYEASTVLLVLYALKKECHLSKLPKIDRDLIASVVTDGYDTYLFTIELDKYNDFILTFKHQNIIDKKKSIVFVNTVANPRQQDLTSEYSDSVPVEVDKETHRIKIGNLTLTKQAIESVAFGKEKTDVPHIETHEKIINTSNKNAYEIRTDVLGMALDFVKYKHNYNESIATINEDLVLTVAKKFYNFVERR